MVRPWKYQSPDTRLRHIKYARDREDTRAAELDEQDVIRQDDVAQAMQREQQRAAELDEQEAIRADDFNQEMEFETQRGIDLDQERTRLAQSRRSYREERLLPTGTGLKIVKRAEDPVLSKGGDAWYEPSARTARVSREIYEGPGGRGTIAHEGGHAAQDHQERLTAAWRRLDPDEKRRFFQTAQNVMGHEGKSTMANRYGVGGIEELYADVVAVTKVRGEKAVPPSLLAATRVAGEPTSAQEKMRFEQARASYLDRQEKQGQRQGRLDYQRTVGDWERQEEGIHPVPGSPEYEPRAAIAPEKREAWREFYNIYKENRDIRLAGLERTNYRRSLDNLPPLTEEEEERKAWDFAQRQLEQRGAVQRGWGTVLGTVGKGLEQIDVPRQVVGKPAAEIALEPLARLSEAGQAIAPARLPGIPSIRGVTDVGVTPEELRGDISTEAMSWVTDPLNAAFFAPAVVRAATKGLRGVKLSAQEGNLLRGAVGSFRRGFAEEGLALAERGGPRVPKPGEELPVALPASERLWQAPIERLVERWPEYQKTWKLTKAARSAEMTKRTRQYMDRLEDLMNQGLLPEEAKQGALTEFRGEMPDIELVEAFVTTPAEAKALTYRALVEFPRETAHPLAGVRALNAITGMADKRTPRPGELKAIREVFGDALGDVMEKALKDKDFGDTLMDLWMFPKVVRSSFDISFPLRQGVMASVRHPLLWSKSIKDSVRAFADPDWMVKEVARLRRDKTPYGVKMPDGSVQDMELGHILDEIMEVLPQDVEPFYHAGMAEKWFDKLFLIESGPVKRSRVAFAGAGNGLRAGMARHWLNHWKNTSVDITPERLEKLGGLLNALTGRATLVGYGEKAGKFPLMDLLQATWWSPQYRLSGPQAFGTLAKHFGPGQVVRGLTGGRIAPSADAQIGRVAAENLVSFVTGGIGMLTLLKASGLADVQIDPRSTDFGKIKLGPTRINFFGTLQLLARSIAQMVTQTRLDPERGPQAQNPFGVLGRYWQSGASPEFSIITDLVAGETYLGRTMRPSEERGVSTVDILERELAPWSNDNRIDPLALADIKQAIEVDGLRGALIGSLGLAGLGVQSYEPRAAQELQAIPEFQELSVPQAQEYRDFFDEVTKFRERTEIGHGLVAPPEEAIRAWGESQNRSPAFIDLAVLLRPGSATRKAARNPEYIAFIAEHYDEIREDAPWLITQEIRLLVHELNKGKKK